MTFLTLDSHEWWVMATAIVCAVACAIPGCFLVLKRMSMLGDAISHAILPGIAVAFFITGSRDVLPMLAGAMAVGMLTALLTSGLARIGRVPEDASMGVVFTSLFALGVILISFAASKVDLDANCVFYGLLEGAAAPENMRSAAGLAYPRSFGVLSGVMLFNALLVLVFWKELKIASFDPAHAASMGISAGVVHYGLMAMVAGTTVASFESVGSILVVAMLIAPGATAHMLTDRLGRMLVLSGVVAAVCAVTGFVGALWLGTTIAGAMSVAAGLAFLLAALFSPSHGVVAKAGAQLALSRRIATEDVLGMLYRVEEAGRPALRGRDIHAALRRPLISRLVLRRLRRGGMVLGGPAGVSLAPTGRDAAARIVRSHRLWETYLAKELGIPLDHLHQPSHRVEHFISGDLERGLRRQVAGSDDPHGKPIPGA
jgi:manganese/zinc/iron transport system permease protein